MIVLLVAAISAWTLSSAARKKGYRSHRFWIYPLAVGAGLYVVGVQLTFVAPRLMTSNLALAAYPHVVGLVSSAVLLALVAKIWKQLRALPDNRPQS